MAWAPHPALQSVGTRDSYQWESHSLVDVTVEGRSDWPSTGQAKANALSTTGTTKLR